MCKRFLCTYLLLTHSLTHSQMMVYVVEQLVEEFETDATKPDSIDMIANKVDHYIDST